ncbi:MAG: nitronate monooxygenase [Candidatus Cloacimonetes bacterium]|nr:nitronate monooxygenase [Candidatus Cloacimonadota bacterium]MCF7813118.1 nitronate monooxygenase [Candidatus Cloacimonadota bacterium]MCF7867566.1 nitronate monooxygenase [Candidatus Cloacimonadota bacterium]MCF7883040.1 nitronate monooxygenase [Candidatus Cloacimonadota bacterium]
MIRIPELKIGNLVAKLPIIQGGMGVGISMAGLASAVANAGGIGVISSVGLGLLNHSTRKTYQEDNQIALRQEIRKARKLSDGIIGLNIMVAISDFDDMVRVALEEKIDILFLGAGLPIKLPQGISLDTLRNSETKVAPIVSSARAAKLIFKSWDKHFGFVPDAVVVEGPLAGGHLGFKPEQLDDPDFSLEKITPAVCDELKVYESKYRKTIPVIAGGGIYDGNDIFKFLHLGASGVQLGTRFVATEECDADIEFKNQYIKCKKEDIVIIQSPVGLPGRAILNDFLNDVKAGIKKPFRCPWKCLKTCDFKTSLYCIANALMKAKIGELKNGFSFAGANAWRVEKIISVKELMDSLVYEFEQAIMKNQFVFGL